MEQKDIYVPGREYEHPFRFSRWSTELWNNPLILRLVKFLRLPIPFDPVINFMWLTGDWNDIHYDIAAAEQSPIGCIAVPGILVESVFSKILGTQFPGHGTVYLSKSLEFRRPLLANSDYLAVVRIEKVFNSRHVLELSTEIFSLDRSTKYVAGTAKIMNKKI